MTTITENEPVPPGTSAGEHRSGLMGRVVTDPKLRRLQHRHALAATALGLGGLAIGIYRAIYVHSVSTPALLCFLVGYLVIGFGLTAGFHRHFTHRSFEAKPAVRVALGILGCMAGQGPIIFWVALHRMHHELADKEGDPHSPNLSGSAAKGLWHAYLGWTTKHNVPNANFYSRDLLRDPLVMKVNKYYHVWVLLGWTIPAAVCGLMLQSWEGAFEGFIWGGLIRMFAVHNIIWWITSFAHVFGARDFRSNDLSTNSLLLAIPTLGEGWHNNHHGFPAAAVLSFRWWQLDATGAAIRLLEKVGLVSNVRFPTEAEMEAKRIRH
jgi:stearoyl-CoA desaturase (delta-9 desaturase)